MTKQKIIITGGHITPALAVLPALKEKYDVVFIGRRYAYEGDRTESFEYTTIKHLGFPFKVLTTGRIQRKLTRYTILSLLKIPLGILQSFWYLLTERPHLILSFGGYLAFPVALAGFLLRIPIITHEQTMTVGLANKVIEKLATKVCISFEETGKDLPKEKVVLTGNPVRLELFSSPKETPFSFSKECFQDGKLLPIIYITGGSGGSHFINSAIAEILEIFLEKYILIHQSGDSTIGNSYQFLDEKRKQLPQNLKERYILQKFVTTQELAWIYHHASLLIGRSGANTTTEIVTFGIPALVIPLTISGGGEQVKQAQFIEKAGYGIMLEQGQASPQAILEKANELIHTHSARKSNEEVAIHKNAGNAIVSIVEELLHDHPKKKA